MGAREIRNKIASIKKTQKITKAMQMVAASKMRRTQDTMSASRPYAQKIKQVIEHLALSNSEYRHPYLTARPVKRAGLIVVSTDRGLCGGLNANLFRSISGFMREQHDQGIEIDVSIIGRKAEGFFKRYGGKVLGSITQLSDKPSLNDFIGVVRVMLQAYDEGKIDAVYIAYNDFVNTMTQKPTTQILLPLPKAEDEALHHHWDYIYEPDAQVLLDQLLTRYIELQVYQAVVENIACEQAAKMVAMKSATDNAGELIKELQLVYNKARQAAITRELAEIVAGAAAV